MLIDSPFYNYHHLTKHTVEKLTSNRHFLDWANQPNPFRFYDGAPEIVLPRELIISPATFFESMQGMAQNKFPQAHEADAAFISNLLFYSMALSAWKQIGNSDHRWALRVNPSSGNLHPTDTHLLLNGVSGLANGAYHYYVPRHSLEHRSPANLASNLWQALTGQDESPKAVICLTSIFWRESWKYQTRAFRYCQHDLGHALASIMLSAAVLGWKLQVIGEFPDAEIIRCLNLEGTDEKPFLILGLYPGDTKIALPQVGDFSRIKEAEFRGNANVLSAEEIKYHAIDDVYESTIITREAWLKRRQQSLPEVVSRPSYIEAIAELPKAPDWQSEGHDSVHRVIRTRRSAVDLDGQRTMSYAELQLILQTATRGFDADFQTGLNTGHDFHLIDLYLYVHRIDGLTAGIYFWDRVKEELVPIALSDQRQIAKFVSCFQDIAADGCFALSMVANFNLGYELFADRCYRYAHYEAGLIGQWIYLSATALNYQATGIGCFLDDEINRYLPLPDGQEVIYNFTVGQAIVDPRLTTLPAYDFADVSL